MPTIDARVKALEEAHPEFSGPLVVWVNGERTDEQAAAIEEAERIGRPVFIMGWAENEL